jgi:hypothetical protein
VQQKYKMNSTKKIVISSQAFSSSMNIQCISSGCHMQPCGGTVFLPPFQHAKCGYSLIWQSPPKNKCCGLMLHHAKNAGHECAAPTMCATPSIISSKGSEHSPALQRLNISQPLTREDSPELPPMPCSNMQPACLPAWFPLQVYMSEPNAETQMCIHSNRMHCLTDCL